MHLVDFLRLFGEYSMLIGLLNIPKKEINEVVQIQFANSSKQFYTPLITFLQLLDEKVHYTLNINTALHTLLFGYVEKRTDTLAIYDMQNIKKQHVKMVLNQKGIHQLKIQSTSTH